MVVSTAIATGTWLVILIYATIAAERGCGDDLALPVHLVEYRRALLAPRSSQREAGAPRAEALSPIVAPTLLTGSREFREAGDLIEIFAINGHARFRIDHQEVYDLKHGSMHSATYLESDNPTDEVDLCPMFSAARPPWLHFCTVRADECTASEHNQQLFHVGKWRFILECELEVALDSAAGAAAAGAGGPTAPPAAKGAGGGVSIVQAVPNGKDDLRDKLVALRARAQGPPLPPPAFPPPGELASAGQGRRAGPRGYDGSEEPQRKHPRVEGAAVLGKAGAGASRGLRDRSLGASKRHGLAEATAAKGIQAASGRRDSPHRSRERAARGERGRSRSRRGSRHRRRSRCRSPSQLESSGSRSWDFPEGRRSKREQVRATMERRPGRITEWLLAKMRTYLPRESRPGSATEPVAMRYLTTQLIPRLGSELNKRNEAELRTLAICLDCLLDGNFVGCTDLLARQFKAVEMAQRGGWAAAQHLNPLHDTLVSAMEEDEREELYRAEQQEMKREELKNRISTGRAQSRGAARSGLGGGGLLDRKLALRARHSEEVTRGLFDPAEPASVYPRRGACPPPSLSLPRSGAETGLSEGLVGGVGIGVLGELLLEFARQGSACKSRAGAPSSWGESCSPSSSRELLSFATSLGLAPCRQHAEYARLLARGDRTGRCALPRPALGLDEWLLLALLGLNALWDGSRALGQQPCAMPVNRPSVAQVACFWHLERKVHSFVTTPGMGVAAEAPVELFATREVSYGGDVAQRAVELTWEQIEPALPPADRCGRLRAVDFCEPRVRRYLEEPIEMLVPLDCFPARPKPGKVMASSTEIIRIGRGLLERGLVAPLRRSDLLHIRGEPVVNGLFGVLKDDLVPSGPLAGQPQLRLIMNLTASNQLMGELPLDIAKLPFYAQWRNIIIDVGEELAWASDASENGGGVAYTSRHTAEGRTAALCELAGGCAHGRDLLVLLEVGGCGRGRMAFDSVGLELSLHGLLSVTLDAARTVRARWPEAEALRDLRAFDAIAARRLLGRAAHATDLVFMCHIGSALELDADLPLICSAQRVLQREGAGLRVWLVCLAAPSTSREQLESVTRAFRSIPLFMDVSTVSESTGCEYCWLSWPLEGGSHLRMSRQPDRIFLSWSESTPAVPPAAAGAGLRSTGARRGARSCPLGKERPAGAAQRGRLQCIALRLGFPHDFFLQARSRKSGCTSEALDQARHAAAAQCGPVAPLAYLVGLWGWQRGFLPDAPTPDVARGGLSAAGSAFVERLAGRAIEEIACAGSHQLSLEAMVRSTIFKGSDVRIATASLCDPSSWPRRGIPAARWDWMTCQAWRWRDAEHINELELRAVLSSVRWRLRSSMQIHSRFVHILDSQVCVGVLCKGRSSARCLQKILARIVSLLLAGSLRPHWVYVRSADNPADAVADYLEALWDDGSPRSLAAHTLSGLQHLVPSLRRELKEGWRLLRTWDQNEMPSRAPPLRPEVAIALAGFALADGREDVATAILAGFNGLLRPSEMLISAGDCVFDHSQRTCVVNLGLTKGGKRQGCPEDVIIDDEFAYLLLRWALAGCAAGTALPPRGLANFRASFASYLGKAGLDPSRIKPYSIRRGGAAHNFSSLGNMALTCERGRWRSRATANIFITEGMAALEAVAVTKQQRAALALGHQLFHRHIERIMDGGK
ncbi:unnamed protein product [Prorocentrum cordatum]|uniref:Uncharacterized protein n=1 Tax=Prorocentrum cordatum TaxID=2364126 RepID=A0ABN9WY66_9DINO|nr:unnamed protein product [Polarella glacialis]